ncbi:MAG: PQQ-binding-like beta-propeller repeat protein [Dehalococcoidia bacterium]|mgnify:CR=1 FL=1|nr:PQQ-binding-like beta-propeller repeat protein [Dehalococcoidia bacterium]
MTIGLTTFTGSDAPTQTQTPTSLPTAPRRRAVRHRPTVVLLLSALLTMACAGIANPNGWASPVVEEGILVTQIDEGELSAFTTPTGDSLALNPTARLWTYPGGTDDDDGVDLKAIYATPLIDGGIVYVAGYSGQVVALTLQNGRPVTSWGGPVDIAERIVATPALHGDVLYIATEVGRLHRLDASNGTRVATPVDIGGRIWAAPYADARGVYVAGIDRDFVAIDGSSGQSRWSRDIGAVAGDPIAVGGLLYVPAFDRRVHVLDLTADGAERWPDGGRGDAWFWSSPLIEGNTVYAVAVDGSVYAFDRDTGALRWRTIAASSDEVRAAPVLQSNVLMIATRDGDIRGFNPTNGTLLWVEHVSGERFYADPLVLESGLVIFTDEDGGLWRVDPSSGNTQPFLESS